MAILGLGRIGHEVTVRMKAFGMKIIGYEFDLCILIKTHHKHSNLVPSFFRKDFKKTSIDILSKIWMIFGNLLTHQKLDSR